MLLTCNILMHCFCSVFRQWVRYCEKYIAKLPISWILGFYVATWDFYSFPFLLHLKLFYAWHVKRGFYSFKCGNEVVATMVPFLSLVNLNNKIICVVFLLYKKHFTPDNGQVTFMFFFINTRSARKAYGNPQKRLPQFVFCLFAEYACR